MSLTGYIEGPLGDDDGDGDGDGESDGRNKNFRGFDPARIVTWDHELDRIAKLPRRPTLDAPDMSHVYRKPGRTATLWQFQSACLWNLYHVGVLVAMGGVGFGKTLVGLLTPIAMNSRRAIYFTTSQLVDQVKADHAQWSKEFYILPLGDLRNPEDGYIYVVGYEAFSSEGQADVLSRIHPDLVVGDEVHKLRNPTAARTKRFFRFMLNENPVCRFVPMSGSFTAKSPRDFAALFELALRKHSPIPSIFRAYRSCTDWCEALEVTRKNALPRQPGALSYLGTAEEAAAMARLDATSQDAARAAFRRRMVETPGVVATTESAIGTTLILTAHRFDVPASVSDALKKLEETWCVGDDEIEEANRFWAVLRQLSLGMYYTWVWPNGVKDEEWILARSAWHKEVREMCAGHGRPGMDTPALLARAADRGLWPSQAWPAWKKVKDRPPPVTTPVWIDDFAVRECQKWLARPENQPGLIWYEHTAFGEAVARRLGLSLAGVAGAPVIAAAMAAGQSCVCSIWSIREGKNLQKVYSRNLVTSPQPAGDITEQMLGRTHRPGQPADEVVADFFAHTEPLKKALQASYVNAGYLEILTGQKQKLRFATRIGW